MSPDRKLRNIALSTLIFTGTACGTAAGKQGPQGERTPIVTPAQVPEKTDTLFEQVNCAKGEMTIPKPAGWFVLEVQISPTFVNCYITKQPIPREEDFRSGFKISKLIGPVQAQDRINYARQLASASEPTNGLFAQANTFHETRVGSFSVFSGVFTTSENRVLSDEERKIILPDGSNLIYIAHFYAPKPNSSDDFKNYGRHMLDGIMIK